MPPPWPRISAAFLGPAKWPNMHLAMAKNPGRRADDISADEVKQFWHDFCERRGVDAATRARGDARIDDDPEYWADQTMPRLLDAVAT